jgi:hypothetical protein
MPTLPEAATHRNYKAGSILVDLSNTEGWESRSTSLTVAELDSVVGSPIYRRVSVDTFRLEGLTECAALDSCRQYWTKIYEIDGSSPTSGTYCDSLGHRINLMEDVVKFGDHYQRSIRAHRVVNGLVVQIICNTQVHEDIGTNPPEMRLRVLRWMSDIRSVEQ